MSNIFLQLNIHITYHLTVSQVGWGVGILLQNVPKFVNQSCVILFKMFFSHMMDLDLIVLGANKPIL